MLTDEEIIKIAADTKTGEPGLHGYILPISFAREIERAVLEKAMQKQEPVANAVYQGCLSGVHVSMLANAPKDFSGYLYASPQPAQAAAIPDDWREIVEAVAHIGIDFGYGKYEIEQYKIDKARAMLSASPKPEHETEKDCCEGGLHWGHSYGCKNVID